MSLRYCNAENYKVNIDRGNLVRRNISLYVACMNARDCGNGDIVRDGRLVAFYSEWTKHIHAGFAANEMEREFLLDAFGPSPEL